MIMVSKEKQRMESGH